MKKFNYLVISFLAIPVVYGQNIQFGTLFKEGLKEDSYQNCVDVVRTKQQQNPRLLKFDSKKLCSCAVNEAIKVIENSNLEEEANRGNITLNDLMNRFNSELSKTLPICFY